MMSTDFIPPAHSSVNEAEDPQYVRELWFEDGSIVIKAGNSLYRVYRGALSNHSPVFRDMLAFPQPPKSDSGLVDGYPFVELPDPDVEVTPFLKAIFEPEYFMPFPAHTTFDAAVGCLHLGNKYGVDYLRARALNHLSSGYPTTLSGFDLLNHYRPDITASALEEQSWESPSDATFTLRAIQLARVVDAPWILPAAFYALSSNFNRVGLVAFHGVLYNGVEIKLTMQEQRSFLQGYNVQRNGTVADALRFLFDPENIPGCKHPPQCVVERWKGLEYIREFIRSHPADPLLTWEWSDWKQLHGMCSKCLKTLKEIHQDARQTFWNQLPETYGLPSWDVLEQMKKNALGPNLTH
ncbi:hypothetical protein R3P38DRAFT_2967546 [Favolaschia claudopus]|uniref:BTB domain-containing protein n=1 Tax=Favolaschia claudopus TaxID=2862362 RepID=A0AAW0B4X9_9AGAR